MKRREFITLLGGGAAAWPLLARAQQSERIRRIGVLLPFAATDPQLQAWVGALLQSLALSGWIIDRNIQRGWSSRCGSDSRQYSVGHHRTVADLDLIQQRYDFAALNLGDWPMAQTRKYQSSQITEPAARRSHRAGEGDLIAILLHSGFEL
jgi:hypothetical protein